ncbi:MAG: hypothetical protein KGL43_05735 [Burkholderiales bacterium]|nr:hypothetical protein [Burkholderiales bacterium]MDE2397938.1 hypothetical protein [Burkholderiales bacterium]MDE2453074.1 hypothetical protein [Burkholderiales bacterium]
MSPRLLVIAPSAILAVAIVVARTSGNDKAPFVVLSVLALLALLFAVSLLAAVAGGFSDGTARRLLLGSACPLVYAAAVIALSRMNLVDPLPWLGFR